MNASRLLIIVGSVIWATACASQAALGPPVLPPRVAAADSAARSALAQEASLSSTTSTSRAIAVAPLAAPANDSILGPLAFGISELIATDLAEARALAVVDRLRLDVLLRELDLAASGRVDSTTAPRLGRLLGANRVIVGAVGGSGAGEVLIDMRIANVTTGAVMQGIDARSSVTRIFDAEKALVFRLLDELGIVPTPRERERIAQRRTDDLTALLAFSRGVEARIRGDLPRARNQFREAARIAPRFTTAQSSLREVEIPVIGTQFGAGDLLARITQATAAGVNPPAPVRIVETVDVPVQTLQQIVDLLITLRVP
jgi:TolB-like protein